jgi:hypothetical protein
MISAAKRQQMVSCILEVVIEMVSFSACLRQGCPRGRLPGSALRLMALGMLVLVGEAGCLAQAGAPADSGAAAKGFFGRWAEFYREDWRPAPAPASSTSAAAPAPARRGLPSPLDSPPFPNADDRMARCR